MKTAKTSFAASLLGIAFTVSSASAAVLTIPDYSLVPDGTNFGSDASNASTQLQITDINALNGGNVLPGGAANSPETIYFVTTFTWGADSDADIFLNFAVTNGADRLGVSVDHLGVVRIIGTAPLPSFALGFAPAGRSVTLLAKLHFDLTNSDTYAQTNTANDTVMNVWVNPNASAEEGSGLAAGDLSTIWNSAGFPRMEQRINNRSTPDTAGTSFITDTVILTGSDATFGNALAIAVPEPSTALLGAFGLLALLRRRRG